MMDGDPAIPNVMALGGPMVITGFSFRMPQDVVDETRFWAALENRKNSSTDWPPDRVCVDGFYDGGSKKPNTVSIFFLKFLLSDSQSELFN